MSTQRYMFIPTTCQAYFVVLFVCFKITSLKQSLNVVVWIIFHELDLLQAFILILFSVPKPNIVVYDPLP